MQKSIKFICLIVLLTFGFIVGCPIKKAFNITCPACGVTHAWLYLFEGKIFEAFNSNFLFLPLTILFFRIIYCDMKKRTLKGIELIVFTFIAIFAFAFNIYRIFVGL